MVLPKLFYRPGWKLRLLSALLKGLVSHIDVRKFPNQKYSQKLNKIWVKMHKSLTVHILTRRNTFFFVKTKSI